MIFKFLQELKHKMQPGAPQPPRGRGRSQPPNLPMQQQQQPQMATPTGQQMPAAGRSRGRGRPAQPQPQSGPFAAAGPRPGPQGPWGPPPSSQGLPRPPQFNPAQSMPAQPMTSRPTGPPQPQGAWARPSAQQQPAAGPQAASAWNRPQAPRPTQPGPPPAQMMSASPPHSSPPPAHAATSEARNTSPPNANAMSRSTHRGGIRGETRDIVDRLERIKMGEAPEMQIASVAPSTGPKSGGAGVKIALLSNYFRLASKPTWIVYQYHVDFEPHLASSKLRKALLKDHKNVLGDYYIFDGMNDLKSMRCLELTEPLTSTLKNDGVVVKISFKQVAKLAKDHPEMRRLFNTQMKRNLQNMGFQLVGKNYFDSKVSTKIQEYNIELWPGYKTPIGDHEGGTLMAVETIHKYLRLDTVLQMMDQYKSQQRISMSNPSARESFEKWCDAEFIGKIVMTRYNNRTYKIEQFCWNKNPNTEFELKDQTKTTFVKYYKQQYDIAIRNLEQPLLTCESKNREIKGTAQVKVLVQLVPELCVMTGLTDEMRANRMAMRKFADHTRMDPKQRVESLNQFMSRMVGCEIVQKQMEHWDLSFEKNLVTFEGRQLPSEEIRQQNKSYFPQMPQADFTYSMRDKHLHCPMKLTNWCFIYSSRDENEANSFVRLLAQVGPPMGMTIETPQRFRLDNDRTSNFVNTVSGSCQGCNMVVCLLPQNRKDRYDGLKKICISMGIPSQMMVTKTIKDPKKAKSVVTKVAIQMNCKLGGEPWELKIPVKGMMVIGYDTYHDATAKGRSIGAFVASMNDSLTKWYSKAIQHELYGAEEVSSNLQQLTAMALMEYKNRNGQYPNRIVYYRDGVGEGQLYHIQQYEVSQVTKGWEQVCGQAPLRLIFIVVTKRINSRFFLNNNRQFTNPAPGTIVDNTITKADRYDFFLVSQSVRQGTVSPTSYVVLHDSSGLQPNHIQQLTYKMTHLYFNWPGTISVPAPCQYAHKLAFLIGQSVHLTDIDANLSRTLFYL